MEFFVNEVNLSEDEIYFAKLESQSVRQEIKIYSGK